VEVKKMDKGKIGNERGRGETAAEVAVVAYRADCAAENELWARSVTYYSDQDVEFSCTKLSFKKQHTLFR
jgi:hypothetical protein